jgi:hypothetical protein
MAVFRRHLANHPKPSTASRGVGRTYGAPTLRDMAEALKKFPRYELEAAAAHEGYGEHAAA